MDLTQTKLSKIEWNMIEVPVSEEEKTILQLIIDGFENPQIYKNSIETMLSFIKIPYSKEMEKTIYKTFFEKDICTFSKKNSILESTAISISRTVNSGAGGKITKADSIRMENINETLKINKENIYEFIQLGFVKKILKYEEESLDKQAYYLYTLHHINLSKINNKNPYVQEFIQVFMNEYIKPELCMHILKNAHEYIEKNKYIIKYGDIELYEHQRQLFSVFRDKGTIEEPRARLILYQAPTGTGKTMSPLGLSQNYRIIFVCVARHVGLALAKSAISMGKKIAFAFGCETAGDIRLHYFAAKEYTKNWKSGMIYKVDNSVGDKVEIMICDIKSYLCAMNYMLAFNSPKDIILYWDEPTITLDVETHELHETIARNWRETEHIPNIVLSCATLPREEEIMDTIEDFRLRFPNAEIHTIASYDTKKSVSLVNKMGYAVTPHTIFKNYADILNCVRHIQNTRAILKYLDVKEISRFIMFVAGENETYLTKTRFKINEYFTHIQDITMTSIKEYYLKLLQNIIPEKWEEIFHHMNKTILPRTLSSITRNTKTIEKIHSTDFGAIPGAPMKRINTMASFEKPKENNMTPAGILFTTEDAHTLTDGPTIYLAEDVNKIARFYLQQSNIPELILSRITATINHNNKINNHIEKLQHDIEDATAKDIDKENKMSQIHRLPQNVQQMMADLETLRRRLQIISLDRVYIPNTLDHQMKWVKKITPQAFSPDIDEQTVEDISSLTNVANSWKILLMMGIGVFSKHESIEYMEIMKKLAYNQKLYMIIASSDYIYGTNYQFCHGIVGKDLLENLTQQKTIQALGRIGRNNIQQDYTIRFREDEIYMNLFQPSIKNNMEAINMCKLFSSATCV